MDAILTMNIHHTAVLLILLTWLTTTLGGMRDEAACNYECHSDGSCSLQVATRQEMCMKYRGRDTSTCTPTSFYAFIPRCKPCTAVCQVSEDNVIGGYFWNMFWRENPSDLDTNAYDLDDMLSN